MSKLEQLAYKMQPAGHEKPQDRRKYDKPNRKLAEAFEKWLKSSATTPAKYYKRALAYTKGIEASVEEAHALLWTRQDHPRIHEAGFFLSAVYNRSNNEEIIFDMNLVTAVNFLAYQLQKNKTFINCADSTGMYCGFHSKGKLINYGKAGIDFGGLNASQVLNYGYSPILGREAKLVINLGACKLVPRCGLLLNLGTVDNVSALSLLDERLQYSPEIKAQMSALKTELEKGRNDYRTALAILKNPAFEKAVYDLQRRK